ncbi:MAG: phosphoribosylaminoimidazolesuccinocarboxamide synthase [Acidiferrobacteraceae bacterium]
MQRKELLYSGKAKSVYITDDPQKLILHFRDDTSAFDGERIERLARKGAVNNRFNAFIMQHLEKAGIPTHFERLLSGDESLVKRLDMIPIECVVRNFSAGSLCKRLGVKEGRELNPPIFEFFFKNDALHDPMVNLHHMLSFGWASAEDARQMEDISREVNVSLEKLFLDAGLLLVDFKLEFGRYDGGLRLGDEFTPDGCRLWDRETRRKLDKDRFRRGLGGVVEAYEEVAARLGVDMETSSA